jgi:ubiquinone biosynthesis protein
MATEERHGNLHARYRQIAQVLSRHGLGSLVGYFGLERFVPFGARERTTTRPEHLRLAIEELGATFIKLGQILSTRSDLLPPDYQAELARLQDQAPPVPSAAICDAIVAELGRPIAEVFASFDDRPLAAASIGQAHAATLPDGTPVVVKVRRPGVVEQVEDDLAILRQLAGVASRRWPAAEGYDLPGLVDEFAETLRAELDYLGEAHNAERFAANFADDPGVHIPRIYREATTARVLTLERVEGIKVDDRGALDAAGVDRPALACRAAKVALEMVFVHGFFHADPHPGNLFVEPGGRIALIDFGMVGKIDEPGREQLAHLLLAIVSREPDRLVDACLALGVAQGPVDRDRLRDDLGALVGRYYDRPLGEIAIGPLLERALAVVREHRLHLPPQFALLLKTLIMEEGLGMVIDPSFHLTVVLAPYARRLLLRRYAPRRLARRFGRAGLDAAEVAGDLPWHIRRLLADIERGGIEFAIRPAHFEPVLGQLERLVNRLVLGILAAAFIVGLAVLLAVYRPPGGAGWAGAFFAVGFALALALGAYLAGSIVRSRRG